MTQSELERRLLALERRLPGSGTYGSPGVSTAFGAAGTNYRDRFPAVLTSTFDGLTGYDWERLVLDRSTSSPSVVAVTDPQSGSYAFTPDNDETLPAGVRGWLEADPNAGGWLFVLSGDGGTDTAAGSCPGGCGTFVGLVDDAALSLEVMCNEGEFDHADFAADFDGTPLANAQLRSTASKEWTLQYWNPDKVPSAGWDDWIFNWSGGSGVLKLTPFTTTGPTDGWPQVTINAQTIATRCFGSDYTFTGGRMNGFNGAGTPPAAPNACAPNDFTLRVSCTCEWIDGWQGDGWYCVVNSTETCGVDGPSCVELKESFGDACDTDIKICSGPYPSQTDCAAACVGAPPPPGPPLSACTDAPGSFNFVPPNTLANAALAAGTTDYWVAGISDTDLFCVTLNSAPGSPAWAAFVYTGPDCAHLVEQGEFAVGAPNLPIDVTPAPGDVLLVVTFRNVPPFGSALAYSVDVANGVC